LAERDAERACLEVEEADAQALEAREFLRGVEGLMGGGGGGVSLRGKSRGPEKVGEDDGLERVDAVVEVIVGNGSDCSSVEDSVTSGDHHQIKEKSVLQQVGKRQQEFNHLPFRRQQMRRAWEEPMRVQMELLTKPLRKFHGHGSPITQIATIDSKRFISSSWDKTIRLWDAEKGTCLCSYHGHKDWVHTIALLDSAFFLSGSDDCTIRLWSINESQCICT
jgi:WD40 repeat protein